MGLFRRRRVEEELLELVRTELGTIRAEIQATLGETAAVLSTRVRTEIEHRMGEPHALAAGLQSVRNTIGARDAEPSAAVPASASSSMALPTPNRHAIWCVGCPADAVISATRSPR